MHEQAATQRVMRSRVDVWCEDIDHNTGALDLDCEMVDFKLLVSKQSMIYTRKTVFRPASRYDGRVETSSSLPHF
jgi:hypothetical protein